MEFIKFSHASFDKTQSVFKNSYFIKINFRNSQVHNQMDYPFKHEDNNFLEGIFNTIFIIVSLNKIHICMELDFLIKNMGIQIQLDMIAVQVNLLNFNKNLFMLKCN